MTGKPSKGRAPVVTDAGAWRTVLWLLLLAVWVFGTASLLGFDAGDPPTHTRSPANDPVRNWCGPVGAWLAYRGVMLLGIGVWVPVLAGGVYLAVTAMGRKVKLVALRAIGVVLLASAAGALQRLLADGSGPFPDVTGGLVGTEATAELSRRFGGLGTFLWLLVAALLGAFVAADRWVILAPLWAGAKLAPAARRAGHAATHTAGSAAVAARGAGSGLLARMAAVVRPGAPAVRDNDLDDDAPDGVVELKPGRSPDRDAAADRPARRSGRGLEQPAAPVEPAGSAAASETEDTDEEEADVASEAVPRAGAAPAEPRRFDADELRAKIARMPVAFSSQSSKLATDDDLRDLQGVTDPRGYRFPGMDLLEDPEKHFSEKLERLVREQAVALESALRQYRIDGSVVGIESGPAITLYDVRLAPGTKVAAIEAVSKDLARALRAVNIRIVPNQAGRDTIGIEVPNPTKEKVRLKELMGNTEAYGSMRLPMFLGKDASGAPLIADLAAMPHMLIAGTTGSGKSVCINTIIVGFLYTRKPSELKLVLVDPKMVEMSQFKDIPHLMCPVVTEMAKAAAILEWATRKMDERYELLAEAGCRDVAAYNALSFDELKDRFRPQTPEEEARIPRRLPDMVFVIDELADLMMTAKEVEGSIIRIAQKARAVGIHLILATQRPQANVVTGLIKSNMPCRVSFKVSSGMDSRIVLDHKGGELLLGQGDMLFLSPHTHKLVRAQGTLVDDGEIRRVVRFMRDVATPTFERQLMQIRSDAAGADELPATENHSSAGLAAAREDPLFERAVEIVLETKRGSVSLLQRRLAIGYTRASRLIDLMGLAGIISDHKGSVARDVLISRDEWDAMKAQAAADAAAGRLPGQQGQGDLFAAAGPGAEDGFSGDDDPDDADPEARDEFEDEDPDDSDPADPAGNGADDSDVLPDDQAEDDEAQDGQDDGADSDGDDDAPWEDQEPAPRRRDRS